MKKNDYRVSVNITVMVLLVLGIVLLTASGISAAPLRIGIAQIVAHPALDDCRDGFIAGMEKAGY
ncbi:MAG TPA: sugar ABC transporter substrate-binding protein, partial [Atribacterota bacterium]|nr:sugar ABC transporter substrate-binding protein [Atribacterota bacterium]